MIYCDLHGHSRKQNVFMYGCNVNDKKAGASCINLPEQLLKERLFPWLMAMKVKHDIREPFNKLRTFDFKSCTHNKNL